MRSMSVSVPVPVPVPVGGTPVGVPVVLPPPGVVPGVVPPPGAVVGVVGTVVTVPPPPVVPAHVGLTKVSWSSVTAALRARARPCTVTLVFTVIELSARMLPRKTESVPSVAELPTCQNTLHSWAPLISVTVLADAVIRVEPAWKMKTELGSPAPSSVSVAA